MSSEHEADRQLRRIAGARVALDVEEARWLVIGMRAGIHERYGYVTFVEYMERELGYEPRVAYERLRVAAALEELPAVRVAMAGGETSYSAVRELTRVATAETEAAWLAAACGRTAREVQAMVRGRRAGALPEEPHVPEPEPRLLRFKVQPETYALFRDAQQQAVEEMGHAVSDDEVIAWLCRSALRGESASTAPPYQIALTVCAVCDGATQDGKGEAIDVGPAVVAEARCDASEIGHVDGVLTRATQTLSDARRLRVLRRDHGRCTVPGCRSTRWLQIHHVVAQEQGGGHEPGNLTVLCGGHHRALHEGRLVITGEAPALTFAHGDGRPWGAAPPSDHAEDARSALRNLGFAAGEAARAVAIAHVSTGHSLEALVRAALAELRPARC